jgi:hypothetical protein
LPSDLPKKHRHLTQNCADHKFCKQDTIPTHTSEYHNTPLISPIEYNEVRRLIVRDTESGGPLSQHRLLELNNEHGWFGHEKPLEPDRKLVMSETALDHWIVSHYEGLSLENIPPNKPPTMSKEIHNMVKKQFF